jgi:hypothetical protein
MALLASSPRPCRGGQQGETGRDKQRRVRPAVPGDRLEHDQRAAAGERLERGGTARVAHHDVGGGEHPGHVFGPAEHAQPGGRLAERGQAPAKPLVAPADHDDLDVRARGQQRGHGALHSAKGERAGAHRGDKTVVIDAQPGPGRRLAGRREAGPDRQRPDRDTRARLGTGRDHRGRVVHDVGDVEVAVEPVRVRIERGHPRPGWHRELTMPAQPAEPGAADGVGGDDHIGIEGGDPRRHPPPAPRSDAPPG